MKTNQPKNIFLGIILMLFSIQSYSQIQELTWHSLIEQDGIEVFYATGNCANTQKLFLKVYNNSSTNLDTNFILVIPQNEVLELPFMLKVDSNEELIINCENSLDSPTILDITIANQETFSCTIKDVIINIQP